MSAAKAALVAAIDHAEKSDRRLQAEIDFLQKELREALKRLDTPDERLPHPATIPIHGTIHDTALRNPIQ